MLFIIGLFTSIEDFKEGKIRNKWIILGTVYGLALLVIFSIWNLIAEPVTEFYYLKIMDLGPDAPWQLITVKWEFLWGTIINSIISFIVGYLLWYFNLWAAGDAKLFFVFSLLLPIKYYQNAALPYFFSFAILINTFIPILLFLICQNLFYIIKKLLDYKKIILNIKEKILKFKSSLKANYLSYLKVLAGYLMIFIFFRLIKSELDNQFSDGLQSLLFLAIIIFRKVLRKFFEKAWILILIFAVISAYLIIGYFLYSQAILPKILLSVKGSLLFMLLFIFISSVLSFVPQKQKKHIPFAFWMFLGVIITMIFKCSLTKLIF